MLRLTIVWLTICLLTAYAQDPETRPVFDAASIKPSDPTKPESFWNVSPGRLNVHNMNLRSLLMAAYRLKRYQVAGGPRWLDDDRFDIAAKLESNGDNLRSKSGAELLGAAFQNLLEDRFQLVFHRDTKQVSGYSLVAAKTGFKLQPIAGDGAASTNTHGGKMKATGVSMDLFANTLSTELNVPIANDTGIEGAFNFTLEWSPDEAPGAASTEKPTAPSIFTALQETLGLKLESRKVTVPVLLIDRAEKPTP